MPVEGRRGPDEEALLERVYAELHAIAAAKLRGERGRASLQTTDLVHEAWLRLRRQERLDWDNKEQFACLAARAIRRILVDRARARGASKRPPPEARESLDGELPMQQGFHAFTAGLDLLALDEALTRLAAEHARAARVIELRFFGGLTEGETARTLALSERSVAGDWAFARAWLRRALEGGAP